MYRPRIIPVLLLKGDVLYKSIKFKNHKYIGDPINAVRIYNDSYADELVFLDISATKNKRLVSIDLIKDIGEEANMPFSVGGGIKTIGNIEKIIKAGAEKIIIGTEACNNPSFIKEASDIFGSSTIAVCIDIKKSIFGKFRVHKKNAKIATDYSPLDFTRLMEDMGAGELIIQSVDLDGTMEGYNLELLKEISSNTTLPIIALGGAGKLLDMKIANQAVTLNGLAAGSMFVYHGPMNGVLLNYPGRNEINDIINF